MSSSKTPNLLFIYTDEQAINTLRTYGNDIIETPNLDRLAEESIVFANPYVTQPVCTPSRSSLLTGLYPHTSGCTENNIPLPADVPCLPEMGDFPGYQTAHYGKWHLGDEVFAQHGFQDWISIEDMYREYYSEDKDKNRHSDYTDYLISEGFSPDIQTEDGYKAFSRGFAARLPERYSKPAFLGRKASNFIENNQDNPFILYVNLLEPHMPYFSCRDDQYSPEEVTLPENFHHEMGEEVPLKLRLFKKAYYENGHSGLSLKTEEDWRKMISNYWGLVSLVDTHVGKILDTLEGAGVKDDTIIVFTSDHGDMMGSHKLLAKCTMFEEAAKVPLIIKIPGMENKKVEKPVSQIDLVPTLLEAMNQDILDHLEGYSWMPYLEDKEELKEENVFIEWNGYNCGLGNEVGSKAKILDCWQGIAPEEKIQKSIGDPIRTVITPEGWKFNWRKHGINQLYNLKKDPYETENLALGDEYSELMAKLKNEIRNCQQRTEDEVIIE